VPRMAPRPAQGDDIIPIPGTKKPKVCAEFTSQPLIVPSPYIYESLPYLNENFAAEDIKLPPEDIQTVGTAVIPRHYCGGRDSGNTFKRTTVITIEGGGDDVGCKCNSWFEWHSEP